MSDTGVLPTCTPNTVSYTLVVLCLAQSKQSDLCQRALAVFRELKDDSSLFLSPNAYSSLNKSVLMEDNVDLAVDLLWEVVDKDLQRKGSPPCIQDVNNILDAWYKSAKCDAAGGVFKLVQHWVRVVRTTPLQVKPNKQTYWLLLRSM